MNKKELKTFQVYFFTCVNIVNCNDNNDINDNDNDNVIFKHSTNILGNLKIVLNGKNVHIKIYIF